MVRYIIMSILVIVGLVLPLAKTWITQDNVLKLYLDQLSSAFLVGGTLSFLFSVFWDKITKQEIFKHLAIRESITNAGLSHIYLDSKDYNFRSMIDSQDELSIVLNDARHWATHYSVELTNRFSEKKTTEFFIVDPDGDFIKCLALKTNVSLDSLISKIESTCCLLKEWYSESDKKGILIIYALKNYPTYSVFCGNEFIAITPYQISSGRRVVPLYIYELDKKKQGIAKDTYEDIIHLRKESRLIWSSGSQ